VHGLFGSSQHWFYQYQLWHPNCSTITFDLYGHGLSTGILTTTQYKPTVVSDDIATVLAWSKATSYVIVGHDHGGVAVQRYATTTGLTDSKLKAIVLADSFDRNPNPFREGGDQAIVQLLASNVFKQRAITAAVQALINPYSPKDLPPRSWQIIAGAGVIANYIAVDQIITTNASFINNSFKKPVLIIYGTQDSIVNSETWTELHKSYKNSKLQKIPTGCFSSQLQVPSVFNAALAKFLMNVSWTA